MSWIVDQDEFAEVELVGESFPFGLVQDAFVVVVSGSKMLSVSDYTPTVSLCTGCVCVAVMSMVYAPMFLRGTLDKSASQMACVASVDIFRYKYLI